jgi:hypothetical protein
MNTKGVALRAEIEKVLDESWTNPVKLRALFIDRILTIVLEEVHKGLPKMKPTHKENGFPKPAITYESYNQAIKDVIKILKELSK